MWLFFLHLRTPSAPSSVTFPVRIFPDQQHGRHSSLSKSSGALFTQAAFSTCSKKSCTKCLQTSVQKTSVTEIKTHSSSNIVITAYQLWNLQACFSRAFQVNKHKYTPTCKAGLFVVKLLSHWSIF